MSNNNAFDIALSFAGEQRYYVEKVAEELIQRNITFFYDEYEEAELWGENLYTYLSDIYKNKARYTIMFISEDYAKKQWTNHERESIQARAFSESNSYILPVRFDQTEIPGILETVHYIDANKVNPKELASLVEKKLANKSNSEANSNNTKISKITKEYTKLHNSVDNSSDPSSTILLYCVLEFNKDSSQKHKQDKLMEIYSTLYEKYEHQFQKETGLENMVFIMLITLRKIKKSNSFSEMKTYVVDFLASSYAFIYEDIFRDCPKLLLPLAFCFPPTGGILVSKALSRDWDLIDYTKNFIKNYGDELLAIAKGFETKDTLQKLINAIIKLENTIMKSDKLYKDYIIECK